MEGDQTSNDTSGAATRLEAGAFERTVSSSPLLSYPEPNKDVILPSQSTQMTALQNKKWVEKFDTTMRNRATRETATLKDPRSYHCHCPKDLDSPVLQQAGLNFLMVTALSLSLGSNVSRSWSRSCPNFYLCFHYDISLITGTDSGQVPSRYAADTPRGSYEIMKRFK